MGQTLRRAGVLLGLGLGCGGLRRRRAAAPARGHGGQAAAGDHVPGHGRPGGDARLQGARRAATSTDTGRTVNIVEVPERDVHLAKLTTRFSAGKAPEVFLLNYRYLGGFADAQGDRSRRAAPGRLRRRSSATTSTRCRWRRSSTTARCSACRRTRRSLAVYYNVDAFAAGRDRAARRLVDLRRVRRRRREADRRRSATASAST